MPKAPDISVTVSETDRANLIRAMRRFSEVTGKDLFDALRFTAWKVALSLGATAKRAKKIRPLKRNPGTKDHPIYQWNRGQRVPAFPFYVEKWVKFKRGGQKHPMKVYILAGDEDTHPDRKVKRAGLAASSWAWAAPKLGKGMGPAPIRREMSGIMKVEQIKRLLDPAVIMTDKLRYIGLVMRGGGKRSMETAFQRAVRSVEHYLANKVNSSLRRVA